MAITATVISLFALFATLYQLYLQRKHNEKSFKPLGQIDVEDHRDHIYIYIRNNGMGPMIIDRLTFLKEGKYYTNIEDCLDLDQRSYMSIAVTDSLKRIVLPNSFLKVFETHFESNEGETEKDIIRKQLASLSLKVEYLDIYDNRMTLQRDFQWFSRQKL